MSNKKLASSNQPNRKPHQKIVIALILNTIVLVIVSAAAYFAVAGTIDYAEAAIFTIIIIIVAFATYILWDITRNVSRGLPAGDERIKNIGYRAGYYGFIAAIWSAVFAPMLASIIFDYEMPADYVSGVVVVGGGLVFAASYLYLSRKGS